ncbi:MAG: Flagellar hook-basal body complex protein FliE, partial [uncultured Friedmanniella sp.]
GRPARRRHAVRPADPRVRPVRRHCRGLPPRLRRGPQAGRAAPADRGRHRHRPRDRLDHRRPPVHDRRVQGLARHRPHRRAAQPRRRGLPGDHEDAGL